MSDTFYVALSGMREAERRLERAAQNIARGPQTAIQELAKESPDTITLSQEGIASAPAVADYSTDLLNARMARNDYRANLEVAATQDELEREVLDLLG
jgi:flagellar basal body rod protein FlgC